MPSKSVRRRRRSRQGFFSVMIATLAVVALALTAAIVITEHMKPDPDALAGGGTDGGHFVDANDPPAQENQLVLDINSFSGTRTPAPGVATPIPTPAPEAEAENTPAPAATSRTDPNAALRPRPLDENSLPIFRKANTTDKKIAITLDECTGVKITQSFALLARNYGAKLTLFPTGENVMRAGMGDLLAACVSELGFEIENRCYSGGARLYRLTDREMAEEIWKQNMALSYAMGAKYEAHFLRLYGGTGETDRRTHAYLKQLGYLGVAHWTINGSASTTDKLEMSIEPGNVYVFKTTESDLTLMKALMREAKTQGYAMVTLNDLFGYAENRHSPASATQILSQTLPELEGYDGAYYLMKQGDCTWATLLLQQRLMALGYLPEGSADGNFGASTAAALSAFQAKSGLAASGAADERTQEYLYKEDALRSED